VDSKLGSGCIFLFRDFTNGLGNGEVWIGYCRFPPVTLSSRHVFVECSLRKVVVD
jgi:hypothetical protein